MRVNVLLCLLLLMIYHYHCSSVKFNDFILFIHSFISLIFVSLCNVVAVLYFCKYICWLARFAYLQLVGYSAPNSLRVRIPAGAAGEFSSPESTLCADSYSVSVQPPCDCSGT